MSSQRVLQKRERPAGAPAARPGGGNRLLIVAVVGAVVAIFITASIGQNPWDALFINPLINVLILFNNIFFNDFGVAIILFTVFMRVITLPLTIRQFQSTKAMTAIQPKLQELQKKYKDPKRRQEETLRLYREAGVNPLGCIFPMLIQMPIWIALYRALVVIVGGTPESLVNLSQQLYPWSYLNQSVPLQQHFLWLNLGHPDTTLTLPILVGLTTYIQQKLTVTPATTPQQQQQMQMMNWMMPLMFAFFTLQVPSGLGLYWLISNISSVFISYFVYGRRGINWRQVLLPLPAPAARAPRPTDKPEAAAPPAKEPDRASAQIPAANAAGTGKRSRHGRRRRGKRKNR